MKFRLRQIHESLDWRLKVWNKVNVQDIINKLIPKHNLHALIIGANDGISFDQDLQKFIYTAQHALFVEPVPLYYSELKQFTDKHNNFHSEQHAISNKLHELTFYYVRNPENYTPESKGYASTNSNHLLKLGIEEKDIASTTVPATTINKILKRHTYNYVQLDTEGMDFEIMKSIDLNQFRPEVIKFEILHMTFWEYSHLKIHLQKRGYKLINLGNKDAVAYQSKRMHNY